MSGATSTFYSARFLLPDYIVREQENVLSCPVWRDGALVAPTAGTGTVYDSTDNIVHTQAVTITGSIASITIPAGTLPSTLSLGSGWRVEWELTVGGSPFFARNKAHLVLSELVPVVTDADLFRRQRGLDPSGPNPISKRTDYQDSIDEAWVTLLGMISGKGPLPFLIMEPTALREPHILLTLSLVFDGLDARTDHDKFAVKAEDYRQQFKDAFAGLAFEYDSDQDGKADSRRKRAASSTIWLTGRY